MDPAFISSGRHPEDRDRSSRRKLSCHTREKFPGIRMSRTRVLVLGASGMLGSAVAMRFLALENEFEIRASVRGRLPDFLPTELAFRVDAFSDDAPVLPDANWAFNCIGSSSNERTLRPRISGQ